MVETHAHIRPCQNGAYTCPSSFRYRYLWVARRVNVENWGRASAEVASGLPAVDAVALVG